MMMTMSQLAKELEVDRRQVYAWSHRSERNGFPAPARKIMQRGRMVPVWHLHEVVDWKRSYRPSRGGRPKSAA